MSVVRNILQNKKWIVLLSFYSEYLSENINNRIGLLCFFRIFLNAVQCKPIKKDWINKEVFWRHFCHVGQCCILKTTDRQQANRHFLMCQMAIFESRNMHEKKETCVKYMTLFFIHLLAHFLAFWFLCLLCFAFLSWWKLSWCWSWWR